MNTANATGALAVDARGLDRLKLQARQEPERALKEAARQFEVLFMNMMLKAMREATPQDGLFDSEQTRLYTTLLDQQLAQTMSARGVGLADVMARQLGRNLAPAAAPDAAQTTVPNVPPLPDTAVNPGQSAPMQPANDARPAPDPGAARPGPSFTSTRDFADRLWPHAAEASRATGIPAHFILGQAALESGWGRREIRGADGTPSYNLFGIKAGNGWRGPTVETTTTEFVNGVARKTVERFRAYSSHAEAFRDYARLLANNPRYAGVLAKGRDAVAFGRELQHAGYATDPQYGAKLARIITGSTLRHSLLG